VVAKFGYWRSIENQFYKCLYPKACLGAKNAEYTDQYPTLDEAHSESCNMRLGFANHSRLCATCKTNFVRGTSVGACTECNTIINSLELIGACIFALGFTLFVVEITVFKPRTFQVSDGVKKIALSYIQMAALATTVDVPWTKSFGGIFTIQTYATSVTDAILSIDCLLPTWSTWEVFQLKLVCVLVFPVLIVPFAYVGVRCRKRGTDRTEHSSVHTYFVSTLVLLLYLLYPTLAKKVITLFTCNVVVDKTQYLQLDPSVPCWHGSHRLWSLSAGLVGVLAFVFGLPLAGYRALRGAEDLSDTKTRLQYGILYDGYRDKFWWWEMTVVGRKIVIILIGAYIKGTQQILTILLGLAILMFMTAFFQPFVNERLLRLELMSLLLCFFTFWVGCMLVTDPHSGEGKFVFGLAAWSVAVLNVMGAIWLFYVFATSFWKEKGAALVVWLHGKVTGVCGGRCVACFLPSGSRRRRESNLELLPCLGVEELDDYNPLDDSDTIAT
jgi:hypothetical protein